MLPSQKSLANGTSLSQSNFDLMTTKDPSFSCLSRGQKEKIDECFLENFDCHEKLVDQDATAPVFTTWQVAVIAGLLGALGGVVLESQSKH
jgi:hypothetical protein